MNFEEYCEYKNKLELDFKQSCFNFNVNDKNSVNNFNELSLKLINDNIKLDQKITGTNTTFLSLFKEVFSKAHKDTYKQVNSDIEPFCYYINENKFKGFIDDCLYY